MSCVCTPEVASTSNVLRPAMPATMDASANAPWASALASIVAGIAGRKTLLVEATSGVQTQLMVTLSYAAMAGVWPLTAALGLDLSAGATLSLFVGALMWAAGAVAVDRRLAAWSLCLIFGLVGMALRPEDAILWIGASGTSGATLLGLLRMRTRTRQVMPLSQQLSAILTSRRNG